MKKLSITFISALALAGGLYVLQVLSPTQAMLRPASAFLEQLFEQLEEQEKQDRNYEYLSGIISNASDLEQLKLYEEMVNEDPDLNQETRRHLQAVVQNRENFIKRKMQTEEEETKKKDEEAETVRQVQQSAIKDRVYYESRIKAAETESDISGLSEEILNSSVLSGEDRDALTCALSCKYTEMVRNQSDKENEQAFVKDRAYYEQKIEDAKTESEIMALHNEITVSSLSLDDKNQLLLKAVLKGSEISDAEDKMAKDEMIQFVLAAIDSERDLDLDSIPRLMESPSEVCSIANVGNSCYFNAVIQQLYRHPEFRQHLIKLRNEAEIKSLKERSDNAFVIYYNLMKIFEALDHGETAGADIEYFVNTIRYILFPDACFNQYDVCEFMRYILDRVGFQQNVNVHDVITIKGNKDGMNLAECPISVLSLGIIGCRSVQTCLDYYLASEELTGDNQYQLPDGRKVDATKQVCISSVSPTLMISLNRFAVQEVDNKVVDVKVFTEIELNPEIVVPIERGREQLHYQLVGVVEHMGLNASGGHYISYVRLQKDKDSWQWVRLNDRGSVDPVIIMENVDNQELKENAYILIYQRV